MLGYSSAAILSCTSHVARSAFLATATLRVTIIFLIIIIKKKFNRYSKHKKRHKQFHCFTDRSCCHNEKESLLLTQPI